MSKFRYDQRRVKRFLVTAVAAVTWLSAAPLIRAENGSPLVDSKEYKLLLRRPGADAKTASCKARSTRPIVQVRPHPYVLV